MLSRRKILIPITEIGGYIGLFCLNWKIGLCVMSIHWSINMATSERMKCQSKTIIKLLTTEREATR